MNRPEAATAVGLSFMLMQRTSEPTSVLEDGSEGRRRGSDILEALGEADLQK